MPTAVGAASEGRAMEQQCTALGLLPSALVGDTRSNAGGVSGEASDPQLLMVLEANLLPVTTTLRCRRADRWRLAADVGGVALPSVWAEAARPELTLACGVSLLVRLARAGRFDSLTRGVAIGLLGEVPMAVSASTLGVAWGLSQGVTAAVSAFTQAQGDGNSLRKAEWVLVTEEAEGLLKMSAVASASSSAGVDSASKGEERCWAVTGAPLRVTIFAGPVGVAPVVCTTLGPLDSSWVVGLKHAQSSIWRSSTSEL